METPEQIRDRLLARFPGADIVVVPNPSPSSQHSLRIDPTHARQIATFLRDDPELRLDYCSNVTGIDWPAKTPAKSMPGAGGKEQGAGNFTAPSTPPPAPAAKPLPLAPNDLQVAADGGHLEVVYHLYSMSRRHGPVVIRLRTGNRSDRVTLPSLTPVWRSCEFQEREVFDLFGVVFEGHPDLRRILMWDEFRDHPMRKDYVEPDDYEWEPTAHGEVSAKAARQKSEGGGPRTEDGQGQTQTGAVVA